MSKKKIIGHNVHRNYRRLNPSCEVLTIEKYRSFPGNENLDNEQAQKEIDSLTILADIVFDYLRVSQNQSPEESYQIGGNKKIAA